MRDLYVSLGHNSSAVLAIDDVVQRGYEQERFDRRKSSSAFPAAAIEACMSNSENPKVDRVFVSHWFDELNLDDNKYLDLKYLRSIAGEVVTLTPEFTHHDAHARSALSFLRSQSARAKEQYVVVVDGFGTFQECLSVYESPSVYHPPELKHRSYGYRVSLGLMYQYVTEYLGMKPHRDEYKLLGYESHVTEHNPVELCRQNHGMLWRQGIDHAHRMMAARKVPKLSGALIDYNNLVLAKSIWEETADMWRRLWPAQASENAMRSTIAFCAQTFLEAAVTELIDICCPDRSKEVVLVGGVFLNVKLSRKVRMTRPDVNVFVHPLCGDQGAAMGHNQSLIYRGNLRWGDREIGAIQDLPMGCHYADEDRWIWHVMERLNEGRVVNVVRGAAEYGPRALCNTTTFAPPTKDSVRDINALNDRDEAMPMAPVMTKISASKYLEKYELDRAVGSDPYMVTTIGFKERPPESMMGVAHKDPLTEEWTARPQVVDDFDPVAEILSYTVKECLINTSFNYHGEPIVQSERDAVNTHLLQCKRALDKGLKEPITVMVRS